MNIKLEELSKLSKLPGFEVRYDSEHKKLVFTIDCEVITPLQIFALNAGNVIFLTMYFKNNQSNQPSSEVEKSINIKDVIQEQFGIKEEDYPLLTMLIDQLDKNRDKLEKTIGQALTTYLMSIIKKFKQMLNSSTK